MGDKLSSRINRFKLFVVILLTTVSQGAFAGGHAGNGGGVSEQYVMHAYLHLGDYIQICLDTNVCRLTKRDRRMLVTILHSLPEEYATHDQIQFRTGAKYRKFFTIDGLIRVAVTGNHVGDPIYFYSNELYSPNGKPITLGFAIGKLVHEMGHHHGVKDTPNDWLDRLGERVELGYEHRALVSQTSVSPNTTFTATSFSATNGYRELIFSDSKKVVDATKLLVGIVAVRCMELHPDEKQHLFDPSPLFNIRNLSWTTYDQISRQAYDHLSTPAKYDMDTLQDLSRSEAQNGFTPVELTISAECPTYPGTQISNWKVTFWINRSLKVDLIESDQYFEYAAHLEHFFNVINEPFFLPRQ